MTNTLLIIAIIAFLLDIITNVAVNIAGMVSTQKISKSNLEIVRQQKELVAKQQSSQIENLENLLDRQDDDLRKANKQIEFLSSQTKSLLKKVLSNKLLDLTALEGAIYKQTLVELDAEKYAERDQMTDKDSSGE